MSLAAQFCRHCCYGKGKVVAAPTLPVAWVWVHRAAEARSCAQGLGSSGLKTL